jgi:hypothetical protein
LTEPKASLQVVEQVQGFCNDLWICGYNPRGTGPNAPITDTAATVHVTPYCMGLMNVKKLPESDVITMGNGSQEVADVVGGHSQQRRATLG